MKYEEVSGWPRKGASKDHTKLKKWIANKYPKVKGAKDFHFKGEGRAFIVEVERSWILDSGASDHVQCRKDLTPREVQRLFTLDQPLMYSTAGTVTSSKMAKGWLKHWGPTYGLWSPIKMLRACYR